MTTTDFTLRQGQTLLQAPRLTPELIADLLAMEPRAAVRRDDDMRVIGIDLPLPDGITYSDGTRARSALLGDRVARDRFGDWLVVHAP
jgi:hypothetical protein